VTALPPNQFVSANGVRLAYVEWPARDVSPEAKRSGGVSPGAPPGEGPATPIICLPHLTGHKGSFGPLAERLAPDWRVLALDLRGRGESDQPAEGYGFAYHARDILAFADALSLPEFVLVGHSFGATVAVYLASIQPSRVRAVILLDGGADPRADTLLAMYAAVQRLEQRYPSLDAYLAAMQALPFFRPWSAALEQYFRDEVETLADGSLRARSSAAAIARDLDQHFFYSMCLHYPALRCPALWLRPNDGLAGERGHVFSEAEAQAVCANIPSCTRVDVPGANHYTMLLADAPPVVGPIRDFLNGLWRLPLQ
jgi:pimeloyl-ACP methyl ester carboxylesterase